MKKRILVLLALMMSILLVGCGGSSSGSDVKDALNDTSVFSQEEINFVNSNFSVLKIGEPISPEQPNLKIKSIVCSPTEIYYSVAGTMTMNSQTINASLKFETKKEVGLYLMKLSGAINGEVVEEILDFDLSLKRLFGEYNESEYFTQPQYDGFYSYIVANPSQVSGISINPDFSYNNDNNIKSLDLYISKDNEDIYDASLFKYNNKYIAVDNFVVIATEDTLVAIFNNQKVKDKIDDVILANTHTTQNTNKNISSASKKSSYNFLNIFKK